MSLPTQIQLHWSANSGPSVTLDLTCNHVLTAYELRLLAVVVRRIEEFRENAGT